MRRGTFKLMKSVNRSLILNKIRTAETISRAQLAKETELTPPTVSSIVKELIEQDMVKESALGKSSGGRKPTMLLVNYNAFYVVGVEVDPTSVKCILTDLSGKVYHSTFFQLELPITNTQFLEILIENINELLRLSQTILDKIIGIGLAMHGVVDVKTGTARLSSILNLKNIPIKTKLENEFNLPVKVENDARAMALGEAWFGGDSDLKGSMVAVNLGRGVGSGIVSNGKLYHGAYGLAGEFGHMVIKMQGKLCECGNRGCLQTLVSEGEIINRAKEKLEESHLHLIDELSIDRIYELAKKGNEGAIEVLEETGEFIGIGLTNLIHIINPSKIVLGGRVMHDEKFILPAIKRAVREYALTAQAKETEVVITQLGKNAMLLGAVSLLLVELFHPVS